VRIDGSLIGNDKIDLTNLIRTGFDTILESEL